MLSKVQIKDVLVKYRLHKNLNEGDSINQSSEL